MTPPSNRHYWTPSFLDSMRQTTDPETDLVARQVFEAGGVMALRQLRGFTDIWDAPLLPSHPEPVRRFFEKAVEFPPWIDYDKIRIVERDFLTDGPLAATTLLFTGPEHFFVNPAGARSFYLAGVFRPESVKNRMFQIPQFIINITEQNGMGQVIGSDGHVMKGGGIWSVQKLRMAHSSIRIMLKMKQKDPANDWDLATLGEPINQEDLCQSVLDFCLATIDGLDRMGVVWSGEQREASLHFWQIVGFLLGLREEMQPHSMEEARELRGMITKRHARGTPEAASVVYDMLGVMRTMMPFWLRPVPAAFMRHLNGQEVSDMIGVPKNPLLAALLFVLSPVLRQTHTFKFVGTMMVPRLIGWLLNGQPADSPAKFRIPPDLAASWRLKD